MTNDNELMLSNAEQAHKAAGDDTWMIAHAIHIMRMNEVTGDSCEEHGCPGADSSDFEDADFVLRIPKIKAAFAALDAIANETIYAEADNPAMSSRLAHEARGHNELLRRLRDVIIDATA